MKYGGKHPKTAQAEFTLQNSMEKMMDGTREKPDVKLITEMDIALFFCTQIKSLSFVNTFVFF